MDAPRDDDSPWAGWHPLRAPRRCVPELRGVDAVRAARVLQRAQSRVLGGWLWLVESAVNGAVVVAAMVWLIPRAGGGEWIFWAVFLPATVAPILLVQGLTYPLLRRRVRAELGTHCPACDYDLRQSADRCPECGRGRAAPYPARPPAGD